MTNLKIFVLLSLLLCNSACDDSITALSATKDGEKLEVGTIIPLQLDQNYPNPTDGATTIRFAVARAMFISLQIFTEDWTDVATVVSNNKDPGYYSVTFSGRNESGDKLPSGDYYYCLMGDGYKLTRVMRIIKYENYD
jgi:hypothetical protein